MTLQRVYGHTCVLEYEQNLTHTNTYTVYLHACTLFIGPSKSNNSVQGSALMRAYHWGVRENVTTPFLVSASPMRRPTVSGCGCHGNVSCVVCIRTRGSVDIEIV